MRRPTIKDVAQLAGVSVSTVSEALRFSGKSKKVGLETCERIVKVASSLNYQPQASARALVTGKTNNIGFLVSSKVSLGFANSYYATLMSGVQACCEDREYHCVIGMSDLSSLENFVIPKKISHRAVDGVVLVGYVDDGVAQKLMDHGLPFIIIEGKEGCIPPGVLAVRGDWGLKYQKGFEHLFGLGHRSFGCGAISNDVSKGRLQQVFDEFSRKHPDEKMELEMYCCREDEYDKFDFGAIIAQKWFQSKKRPAAILGFDQFCVGFLGHALRLGIKCPQDVSVMSDCDSVLCQRMYPKITAIREPISENAYNATGLFVDFVQGQINWIEINRRVEGLWKSGELVANESTGVAPKKQICD